ncbi:MAG: hypothetical protein COV45_04260 [Deltaproteobacteria bacterium CG11_big_fil_rev_8_21_14_0_20_47_16]|nr:MAG: hypothetical protein COV45_04260 [Deltaproteobacteria bacterium CG11_big_fil_rev_8_21_14_0_20_47_16]
MYFHFLPTSQKYDGAQLRSQFILETTGHMGDGVIAFCGAAEVGAAHMVDQEDIATASWIKSNNMLHFIAEHFHMPLREGIAHQRLLVSSIHAALQKIKPECKVLRSGDDLFDGDAKLTVSIAAASPQSTCIHTAINIDSQNTPVKTRGLDDYKISAMPFALDVLRRYSQECHDIFIASCKVKPIP